MDLFCVQTAETQQNRRRCRLFEVKRGARIYTNTSRRCLFHHFSFITGRVQIEHNVQAGRIGPLGGPKCEFGFRTRQDPPHPFPQAEATVFEIEARPTDTITLALDDKTVSQTLAEAMGRSRLEIWLAESAERIARTFGTDVGAIRRRDRIYFFSHKVKLHRAIPEVGYAVELDHTDADPPPGENHYRARVHQRNGQVAWSSPVWVDNS